MQGAVGSVVIEMRRVLGQYVFEMAPVDDQHPVEQFTAHGADPSFGDCVGPRRQLHLIPTIGIAASG